MTAPQPPPVLPLAPRPPGSPMSPAAIVALSVLAVVLLCCVGGTIVNLASGGSAENIREQDDEIAALLSPTPSPSPSPEPSPTPEAPLPPSPKKVQVPDVVGLSLETALDLADRRGLTGMTVCKTVGGDVPLWFSNWKVLDQEVKAGTWIWPDDEVCLGAVKKQDL